MTNNEILKIADDAATKALTDIEFRKRLAADGNKTIKEEYGKEFPVKVTFHEVTDKKLPFVLPAKAKEGELGDDALGEVFGGRFDPQVDASKLNIIGMRMAYACPEMRQPGFTYQNGTQSILG